MKKYWLLGSCSILICALDQLTKRIIWESIPPYGSVPVIDGFFDLVHIYNRGAAFGFLNRSDIEWQFWLFLGATCCATVAILLLVRSTHKEPLLVTGLGLVLGGAIGNLIDRIRWRAVLDFVDIYVGQWHWPAFNIADIGICSGAGLALLALFLRPQEQKGKESDA